MKSTTLSAFCFVSVFHVFAGSPCCLLPVRVIKYFVMKHNKRLKHLCNETSLFKTLVCSNCVSGCFFSVVVVFVQSIAARLVIL